MVEVENCNNPFAQDKLSPEHLSLLFPAAFYQSDEALALHLTESCLVEATTWEGDNAIGETAFWLKVLSTPQTDYLKKQKRLFKHAIFEKCRNLCLNVMVATNRPSVSTVTTSLIKVTEEKECGASKEQAPLVTNKPKTVITIKDPLPVATAVDFVETPLAESEWQQMEKANTPQIGQETLDAVASPTPGFGLKSFKCKLCIFATDTRERLNHHQKYSHSEERPYSCHLCNYTSKYPWNIKTHIENVHLKTKKFQCDKCSFTSPQACLLRRHHNRVHSNLKNIKCDLCDYRTNHKDVLRRHVHMKHTKEFDHKCPYCDFGRDAKYEVEDHINAVHLMKVIYQCSECSFQTYRKITLRSHHKDHETKKVIKCPCCDHKSIYPSVLAKHIKSEHPDADLPEELKDLRKKGEPKALSTDDADYTPVLMCKCKLCDFTSETISKLKAHVRRIHKGTNHMCEPCGITFANKRNLKKHNERKHSNTLRDKREENSAVDSCEPTQPSKEKTDMVEAEDISNSADLVNE